MGLGTISELETGATFADRYALERLLGSGGMGKVYLVSDSMLPGEKVALKVLNLELGSQDALIQRFLREVQLTRRVTHRNVVRTFDVGNSAGRLYFTMEVIEGQTLRELVGGQPLPIEEALRFLQQLCYGLAAIHHHDIVHRDLKSSNVIATPDGILKITDFGVARPGASELTGSDELLGSATHIAPETWKSGEATHLSDIYALGVIAYEMVTGILPFDGRTPHELMFKHLKLAPVPPVEINPEVPRWLDSLIIRMLDKDPSMRPASAEAVVREATTRMRKSTVEDVRALSFEQEVDTPFGNEGPMLESGEVYSAAHTSDELEGPNTVELSFVDRVRFTIEPTPLEADQQLAEQRLAAPESLGTGLEWWFEARRGLGAIAIFAAISALALVLALGAPVEWTWGIKQLSAEPPAFVISALLTLVVIWLVVAAPFLAATWVTEASRRTVLSVIAVCAIPIIGLALYSFGYLVSWSAHNEGKNTLGVMANAIALTAQLLGLSISAPLQAHSFIVAQVGPLLQLIPSGIKLWGGAIPALIAPGALIVCTRIALGLILESKDTSKAWYLTAIAWAPLLLVSLLIRFHVVNPTEFSLSLGLVSFQTNWLGVSTFGMCWSLILFSLGRPLPR